MANKSRPKQLSFRVNEEEWELQQQLMFKGSEEKLWL